MAQVQYGETEKEENQRNTLKVTFSLFLIVPLFLEDGVK